MNFKRPLVIFVMGVSGVGKSTIGNLISKEYSIPFFDADDYHPAENIEKMKSGQSLNDIDRIPWLKTLNELASSEIKKHSCVIACSALKNKYRTILQHGIEFHTKWIFLSGTFDLVQQRMKLRNEHFMPSSLLKSQFEILQIPSNAITIPIHQSLEKIMAQIKNDLFEKSEFGVIGLGVMGTSLARNLASKGANISIFNRHVAHKEEHIALDATQEHPELKNAKPFDNLKQFINSLQKPRKILLMVNAGKPVDAVIDNLLPLISENDVLIDGGNSHFEDTLRRIESLKNSKVHFIGAGISGGEEGALNGPSIMPSGDIDGYKFVQPFLEKIAAKDKINNPCCTYIGPEGSGHFIKMVHNGIEYAEMQLLAEVYFIFKKAGKNPNEIAKILESWKSKANSYLLEITIDILKTKEGDDWLLNKILDTSGNKGTGNWTTIASAQLGMPSTMISSALFARYISSFKDARLELSKKSNQGNVNIQVDAAIVFSGYQFARIINHSQGFNLIQEASKFYNWNLNLSEIARIWTNGCIIRSNLMEDLIDHLKDTSNLMLNDTLNDILKEDYEGVKQLVSACVLNEIPTPCLSDALNFFNNYKTAYSSANMIQAQRDYFGAHTYERLDDTTGKAYHTNWKNL